MGVREKSALPAAGTCGSRPLQVVCSARPRARGGHRRQRHRGDAAASLALGGADRRQNQQKLHPLSQGSPRAFLTRLPLLRRVCVRQLFPSPFSAPHESSYLLCRVYLWD